MSDSISIDSHEFAELERLALVGELTGTLVHDCNNFLNVVLLQAALLEMSGSAAVRLQLADLRSEGEQFKAMLGQLQKFRSPTPVPPYLVDVNSLARSVVDSVYSQTPGLVRLELSPGALEVSGTASELRRLIHLLLADQTRLAGGRPLVVRSHAAGDGIRLGFEHSPGVAPSAAVAVAGHRQPPPSLALATCRAIARRLRLKIHEERKPDGAATMAIEFPAPMSQPA